LQLALTLNGHDVRIAPDGRAGIDAAADFRPEVVICDIGLPGMDGYAVARALRKQGMHRDAFLIALSGYARPEDIDRARQAGFNRHLAKPASVEVLESLMAERDAGVPPSALAGEAG
jgi:two-component system CheB/CheR fusion protein